MSTGPDVYVQKLLSLRAAGRLRAGEVHNIEVQHDDWCPRLVGGRCICDPHLILDGRRVEVASS